MNENRSRKIYEFRWNENPKKDLAVESSNKSEAIEEKLAVEQKERKSSEKDSEATDKIEDKQSKIDEGKLDGIIPTKNRDIETNEVEQLAARVAELKQQKDSLEGQIEILSENKSQILSERHQIQETLAKIVKVGLADLEARKQALQIEIEQLERRRERIREEMRTSFAGISQELAIRVQGFKDYLVGSLQDLAAAAEQLELPATKKWERPKETKAESHDEALKPQFAKQEFQDQRKQIRRILDQYRTLPDYYGPPWQLRRTFEPIHAERVESWFFSQGGRGAIPTMGSRLQNILLASAVISVLQSLYGDTKGNPKAVRLRTLVLANTPERLGEWRRGLQDCLGISRSDFGPDRGIVLFEATDALVQKADRLLQEKCLPLAIVDETEDRVSLSLLQFPLWLAFAPDPQQMSSYMF